MPQYADPRYPGLIESNQHGETFFRGDLDDVKVRLLSFRCQDARQASLPCQDYALLACRLQQSSLAFCVSDGVGGSYRGDFAAHYLTNCLVDWLQTLPDLHVDAHTLTTQLEQQLHLWAEVGQEEWEQDALPADLPNFLHEILLEHRDTHGSETVFFAGRIDYASPFSTQNRDAFFCWMGNVSAQLFFVPGKYMLLCDEENATSDRNRWSTLRGPRGLLTGLTMDVSMVERLLVYTDGLAPVSEELANFDDETLPGKANDLLRLPTNDDMTVLDLQWKDAGKHILEEDRHA